MERLADNFCCSDKFFVETLVGGVLRPKTAVLDLDCVSCSRVEGAVRGALMVLIHWGAPLQVLRSCATAMWHKLHVRDEAAFVKEAKAIVVWPLSRMLSGSGAVGGWPFGHCSHFRRWAKARLGYSPNHVQLWFSFWQSKRACFPLSEEFVKASLRDHQASLTKDDVPKMDPTTAGNLVRSEIDVIRSELIKKALRCPSELVKAPSGAACFENPRSQGGTRGYCRTIVSDTDPREVRTELQPVGVVGYDGKKILTTVWKLDQGEEPTNFYRSARSLLGQHRRFDHEPIRAESAAIAEPLKVRVITKGPMAEYAMGHFYQRCAHDALRQMPDTRLIGKPFSPEMLVDLVTKERDYHLALQAGERPRFLERGGRAAQDFDQLDELEWVWYSADYSAATDASSSYIAVELLKMTLLGFPDDIMADAILECLEPHIIVHDGVEVIQRRGQLMGSPVSFILLCLLNLFTVREADRVYGLMGRHPCLVNGDDLLARRPLGWCDVHKRVAMTVGLNVNDKTHIHQSYANINSLAMHAPVSGGVLGFVQTLPYLPVGHFFRQQKVQIDDQGRNQFDAVAAIRLATDFGKDFTAKMLDQHSSLLARACRGRNLWIPTVQGGMGLIAPAGFKFFVTEAQRSVALERLYRLKLSERPVPPHLREVEVVRTDKHGVQPWRSWFEEPPAAAERVTGSGRKCRLDWKLSRVVPCVPVSPPARPRR